MYARRAAMLCNGECTPRDGLSPLPCAKGRAEGVVRACHARVVLGALGRALPRKVGKFEGKCSGPKAEISIKLKLGPSRWSITIFFGKN